MIGEPQFDTLSDLADGAKAQERPHVTAVMPCLNEEATVGLCVEKAFQSFRAMGIRGEVIVADNGSTDRSIEIAEALGARVVRQEIRGYGAALGMGIGAARGDVIVMGDADDTYDWSSIGEFIQKVDEGYDLVMGNRFKGGIMPGAMPPLHRYLGNPVLSAISRIAFGAPISDFHCGMRAFTREAFERMRTRASGMEFATEMIANAAIQRLRICEIPTTLRPDKRDRPPHLRSFRDGWRHLRFILTFAPDYLYFVPGIVMLGLGAALLALLAGGPIEVHGHRMGIHFVALGAMLALIGFNVLNMGILAKTIIARRFTGMRSRTVRLMTGRFSLELGLVVGGVLFLAGVGIDSWILQRWWTTGQGPMAETVHLSFVATTSAVLGLNLAFNSFLLALLVSTDTDAR